MHLGCGSGSATLLQKGEETKGQKFLYKEDSEPKELGMTVATQRAPLNIWGKKKREKQKNR